MDMGQINNTNLIRMMNNRFPRKFKKRLIKVFGRRTYFGILEDILAMEPITRNGRRGIRIKYVNGNLKTLQKNGFPYHAGQITIHTHILNLI